MKRSRRVLSLLLALALCLCLLPVAAFAETKVESFDITVHPPIVGETPDMKPFFPVGCHVERGTVTWYHVDKETKARIGDPLTASSVFEAGEKYELYMTVKVDSGYTVDYSSTVVTIDGKTTWGPGTAATKHYYTYFTAAEPITMVEYTAVDPIEGAKPDFSPQVPDDANYTVSEVKWSEFGKDTYLLPDYVFVAGKDYVRRVKFSPKSGYAFAKDCKAKLNGNGTPIALQYGYDCWSQTPVTAKAITNITKVAVTAPAPVAGQKPVTDASKFSVPSGAEYTIPSTDSIEWGILDDKGNMKTMGDGVFEPGVTYVVAVLLQAKAGYQFPEASSITGTVNGEAACDWQEDPMEDGSKAYILIIGKFTMPEAATATVSFDANGGAGTMAEVTVNQGDKYALPENGFTAPAGKTFDKWDQGAPGDEITVSADTVLKAQWKDVTDPAKITFDANGGAGTMAEVTVNKGDKYTLPENGFTAPAGKTFDKWDLGAPGAAVEITGDTVVKAVWKDTSAKVNPFVDVKESDVFYDAVLWAYYASPQVTKGISDTHFGPNSTVTRGQTVAFLWRAMGEPEPTSTKNPFTDVKESDYYYKAVLWAVEKKITVGVTPTQFVPSQTCSTAHIITFLYRTLGIGDNGWYDVAGAWATGAGLLKDLTLKVDPKTPCPRADVVLFLYRALK